MFVIFENEKDSSGYPPELQSILRKRFLNRYEWFGASDQFRKDFPTCFNRLFALLKRDKPEDTGMVGQTNFHDEDQLESILLMLSEFFKKGMKVRMFTVLSEEKFGTLEQAFEKYLALPVAFKTPDTSDPVLWKQFLNARLREVLDFHEVYRVVSANPKQDRRLRLPALRAAKAA